MELNIIFLFLIPLFRDFKYHILLQQMYTNLNHNNVITHQLMHVSGLYGTSPGSAQMHTANVESFIISSM